MSAVALQHRFASLLAEPIGWQQPHTPESVSSGIPQIDAKAPLGSGGLPRGALTEIVGPASSGRTTMLDSILAHATARQEVCALVDAADAFCPHDAARAGVALDRLLWVRCAHNPEHALKAADLLIQGGGFGLVALDLGDTPPAIARRIPLASWFRLRRAVENTPTIFLVLARQSNARTCASLIVECQPARTSWSGARGVSRLLRSAGYQPRLDRKKQPGETASIGLCRRPTCTPVFTARAI